MYYVLTFYLGGAFVAFFSVPWFFEISTRVYNREFREHKLIHRILGFVFVSLVWPLFVVWSILGLLELSRVKKT